MTHAPQQPTDAGAGSSRSTPLSATTMLALASALLLVLAIVVLMPDESRWRQGTAEGGPTARIDLDAQRRIITGREAMARGDYTLAAQVFQAVLDRDPHNLEAQQLRHSANVALVVDNLRQELARRNDERETRRNLPASPAFQVSQTRSLDPLEYELQEKLRVAIQSTSSGDEQDAMQSLRFILAMDPPRLTQAARDAQALLEKLQCGTGHDRQDDEQLLRQAVAAFESGTFPAARGALRELLARSPGNHTAASLLDEVQQVLDEAATFVWEEAVHREEAGEVDSAIHCYHLVLEYSASPQAPLARQAQRRLDALTEDGSR